MVIVPYIRHNAVHTAQCRMPYEICHTGARILSIISKQQFLVTTYDVSLCEIAVGPKQSHLKSHNDLKKDGEQSLSRYSVFVCLDSNMTL